MSPRRIVVVGNGMVAASFLEELVARAGGVAEVTVFGDEPGPAYDRIKLSTLLAGRCQREALTLLDRSWYRRHHVTLRDGVRVVGIDRAARSIHDAGGGVTGYDELVLATGSQPLVPPIEGLHRGGVHTFRTVADIDDIIDGASRSSRAVVVGGGLLGLEAAYGLRARGLEVDVVHLVDRLMERQLDAPGARLLKAELRDLGIGIHLGAETAAFTGNGRVEGVVLRDGRVLGADLVVIACGIRPDAALAAGAGLEVRRGVVVDDRLRTSDPSISAIGECTEHRGVCYGIVAPLRRQASVLAASLCGDRAEWEGGVCATTLKVAGVDVFCAGAVDAHAGDDVLCLEDTGNGVYKRLLIQQGRVRGAILVGDLSTAPRVTQAINEGLTLNGDRLSLVAPPPAETALGLAAQLSDDAVVCGCNGVSAGTIRATIQDRACSTRAEITRCTRAAGSCGSCGGTVDALLCAQGAPAVPAASEPSFCACVPLPRALLRERIAEQDLRSVQAVLDTLGNGAGCARCKPALALLLDVHWCGDYDEDRSARFINDRVHANIQRDGTFSVVPRMHGGVTSPAELRRIADVAERFDVPMVKVTGGQRIDLLGVRKEQLPGIWQALGMPSGHAYAKAVRTVKTCVGTDFCRFGVGDSTAVGIALEHMLTGLYTPHKVKMGVTGCPRNCAEVTVKDIGIVAIATGWEVYVGGAAGMSVRKGDLLCTVERADEALRAAALFFQHYREEAEYLERTYHYMARAGIESVRAATVEAARPEQDALLGRLDRARGRVRDPWVTEAAVPRTQYQFESIDETSTASDSARSDPMDRAGALLRPLPVLGSR